MRRFPFHVQTCENTSFKLEITSGRFLTRQMDSFQGSLPPKFISFRLENQIPAEDTTTIPEIISPPVSADSTILDPQTVADLLNSPRVLTSKRALRR